MFVPSSYEFLTRINVATTRRQFRTCNRQAKNNLKREHVQAESEIV